MAARQAVVIIAILIGFILACLLSWAVWLTWMVVRILRELTEPQDQPSSEQPATCVGFILHGDERPERITSSDPNDVRYSVTISTMN